jgi:type 1 glutamine amidotransferase
MKLKSIFVPSLAFITALLLSSCSENSKPLKALIIDGQNNHTIWPKSTVMMKHYLEETGLFEVDVARTQYTWKGEEHLANYPIPGLPKTEALDEPKPDPNFKPDFSQYDVVISNFGWRAADWPQETKDAFEKYVREGGGFVPVHAANNSFGDWDAYNKMIAIGGWGGRNVSSGNYLYYDAMQKLVKDPSDGKSGSHGPQHSFVVSTREKDHPITRGLPDEWLHAKDELYDRLRGPTENVTVLATAYSDPEQKGTDRHEPMMLTIDYGEGRVFHTAMGHTDYSIECVGFITTFCRGVEWAATGNVTQPIPSDFPSAEATSSRKFD